MLPKPEAAARREKIHWQHWDCEQLPHSPTAPTAAPARCKTGAALLGQKRWLHPTMQAQAGRVTPRATLPSCDTAQLHQEKPPVCVGPGLLLGHRSLQGPSRSVCTQPGAACAASAHSLLHPHYTDSLSHCHSTPSASRHRDTRALITTPSG